MAIFLPEKPIIWLIDDLLLERHDRVDFPDIAVAAREAGHEVIMKTHVPFSDDISLDMLDNRWSKQPIVAYGCVGFIKQIQKHPYAKYGCPITYLKKDELRFSTAAAMWGNYMLNDKFIMLPYAELKRRIYEDIELNYRPRHFFSTSLFMRPDVVTKPFAGRVFRFYTDEDNVEALDKYEKIDPREIVIIAAEIGIRAEFRHVIVNGKVVAESQYIRDNVLDIRIDVDRNCHRLAKYIAGKNNDYEWEPDYVYVVDTALTVDGPRIIEFNSFSCSGLYAMDTRKIVKEVSAQAWREFTGDLD